MGLLSNLESLNLSKSGHCSFLMDFIFVDIPLLQIAEDDFSSKAISVVIVGQSVCRISPIQGGVYHALFRHLPWIYCHSRCLPSRGGSFEQLLT